MEHGSCFLADAVVGDDRRYAIEAAERGELQCQAATTHQRTQIGQTSPVTNFSVATNEYRGGEERTEYHSIVTRVQEFLCRTTDLPVASKSDGLA